MAAFVLGLGLITLGVNTPQATAATPERPDVYVDGEWIRFDVQPQVYQYRTLVPIRMIFEALGADVSWEANTQTAVATKGGVTLRIPVGSHTLYKNGQALSTDVAAQLVNNRTMVPVRIVAESFGDEVLWNEAIGRVTINSVNTPKVRIVGDDYNSLQDGMAAGVQKLVRDQLLEKLVENELGKSFQKPVWIYLSNSRTGFQQNISKYGNDPDAATVAGVAEGVTYGSRVLLPLQKLTGDRDRTQTIAHELMHVLLNQNGGQNLPAWLHEGLAWQTGLDAKYQSQPAVLRNQMDGILRDYVLNVVEKGEYQPLVTSFSGTFDALKSAGYNVELQDYYAYKYLITTYGKPKLLNYLNRVAAGESDAFSKAIGVPMQAFESGYKAYLQQELKHTAQGMEITLQVPNNFQGQVHLLPEGSGSSATQVLTLAPGVQKIRIYKDGHIEGVSSRLESDKAERASGTVYLFLDLAQAVKEQGVMSQSGGLGFYDSYGEYYFAYTWLNTKQDAVYPETNKLFGLEILDVRSF